MLRMRFSAIKSCHELAHAIDKAHNGRFVTASELCARAHFPAFWGFYINHLIGESVSGCGEFRGPSNVGDTALHHASRNSTAATVYYLLQCATTTAAQVDTQNALKQAPLMIAAGSPVSNVDVLRVLVADGRSDVNARNSGPLIAALRCQRADDCGGVDVLLVAGANAGAAVRAGLGRRGGYHHHRHDLEDMRTLHIVRIILCAMPDDEFDRSFAQEFQEHVDNRGERSYSGRFVEFHVPTGWFDRTFILFVVRGMPVPPDWRDPVVIDAEERAMFQVCWPYVVRPRLTTVAIALAVLNFPVLVVQFIVDAMMYASGVVTMHNKWQVLAIIRNTFKRLRGVTW
jgi:hypothetical protein